MSTHTFHAMGTQWWIHCDPRGLSDEAEALVRQLEARLSRFLATSSLSQLNRTRAAICPTLAAVTRLALDFQAGTGGAFDPTLGAELSRLGYDRSFDALGTCLSAPPAPSPTKPGPTRVTVEGDLVRLDGPGDLDLGGLGKGYAVDRVVALLVARGARSLLVDGGGDIRGFGDSYLIGCGSGHLFETRLGAIATSSTRDRRWSTRERELHHIVDPRTRLPAESELDLATVVAPDALTADALATALIVDPDVVVPRLVAFGAHALVRTRDGAWWATPGAPFGPAQERRYEPAHEPEQMAVAS